MTSADDTKVLHDDSVFHWAEALFYEPFYSEKKIDKKFRDNDSTVENFVTFGAERNISPSPLFSIQYYRRVRSADEGAGPELAKGVFFDWVKNGVARRIVPTIHFDNEWYEDQYADDLADGQWGFEHYLTRGRLEPLRFRPNPWFSPEQLLAPGSTPFPPDRVYEACLHTGNKLSRPFNPYLRTWGRPYGPAWLPEGSPPIEPVGGMPPRRLLDSLCRGWEGDDVRRHFRHVSMLVTIFQREFYVRVAELDPMTPHVDAFFDFLRTGLDRGLPPTPFFDPDIYVERLAEAGHALPEPEQAFRHWLEHRKDHGIVPTLLMDRDYYLDQVERADAAAAAADPLVHYLTEGVANRLSPAPDVTRALLDKAMRISAGEIPGIYRYLLFAENEEEYFDAGPSVAAVGTRTYPNGVSFALSRLETYLKNARPDKIRARLKGPVISEIWRRATELEPRVGHSDHTFRLAIPPFQSALANVVEPMRRMLERSQYDTVVCVPHCRMSGAALVAGAFCKAMRKAYPERSMLLVRTDGPYFQRPEWFPEEIGNVDISSFARSIPPHDRDRLLMDLLIGVAPSMIVNVNSYLAWNTFLEFGDRLKLFADLYAYMFCFDHNKQDVLTGYPARFFDTTIDNLSGVMLDTQYLKNQLTDIFKLPKAIQDKLWPIYSYVPMPPRDEPLVNTLAARDRPDGRWRVFWGGRLDRQKRFDVVIEIARAMPDIDFVCWGAAVLDENPYDPSTFPDNLTLNDPYESFETLPIDECDLWLYTSQWDGLPTVLIEVGLAGLPIVASRVGGVGELVSEETGYPVDAFDDPRAYIEQIRAIQQAPEVAVEKTRRLHELAITRHAQDRYADDLKQMLGEGS
ncbi:glycosyltransferase family 4 protein [Rhodobium gokarnense]|uniref:Glycosyltransferase involved in cell wall biosynthesis n=1 Tax=Rhodobium gokarnense TaxID=364296 RepID=A0ABT3HE75_9HYPH|nr:glycosyltransferase family 4 protein [Rhodobium gokarnense]MCW2308629.1 glycosyltransferase involved in cell wall biosynthesis [Rhodobium gokarnense]